MRKLFLPLMISMAVMACTDDSTDEGTPENESPLEATGCQFTGTYNEFEGDSEEVVVAYDADGKVTKITETFTETTDGVESTFSTEYRSVYSGELLTEVQVYAGGELTQSVKITYEEEQVAQINIEDVDDPDIEQFRFVYDGEELSVVENWDNYSDESSDEFTRYATYRYLYEEGNLKKITYILEGESQPSETNVYTYDDQINPIQGNLAWLIYADNYAAYVSANNVVTHTETSTSDGETETDLYNYSYVFSDKGLPTKVTISSEGDSDWSYDLTYQCN
ncbi:hypothetical protein [Marinoscillum furvescens]|uniref:YD repeat-containing protein n=1 Tax=Marinoscillum furvescens DSM 4134 TaxID=1122208 RepID=A0A3D9LIA3_MARFU|nr:hypothetical protein [Marinoscillum furvescens]REE05553.1 hypothetical protein C7460_10169 [Marinoscillum furvescens DSM 4134]